MKSSMDTIKYRNSILLANSSEACEFNRRGRLIAESIAEATPKKKREYPRLRRAAIWLVEHAGCLLIGAIFYWAFGVYF